MDIVDPTAIPDPLDAIERPEPKTEDEITRWRAKSATEKVRMADKLLKAALRSNPQGVRNVIRSRLKT